MASRLATVMSPAAINTFQLIAGESVFGDSSHWDHNLTLATVPDDILGGGSGAGQSGVMAEKFSAIYDVEKRWVVISGLPHLSGSGIRSHHRLFRYDIDTNTVIDRGYTDPIGLLNGTAAYGTNLNVSIPPGGAAAGLASYIAVPQDATSGSGVGATWNVTRYNGSYVYAGVNDNSGPAITGYNNGDTVTIRGNHLGGSTPANDLVLTITSQTVLNNNGHGYNLSTYCSQNRMFYRCQTNAGNIEGCNFDNDFASLSSSDWSLNPVPPVFYTPGTFRGTLMYVPERSALWYFNMATNELLELNLKTGASWQLLYTFSGANLLTSDGTCFYYNAPRHSVICGGGQDLSGNRHPVLYEIAINPDDRTTSGITVTKLDNIPMDVYFAAGFSMGAVDPITGHFLVFAAQIADFTLLQGIWECDPSASSTNQWTRRYDLESMPKMGDQGSYFSNVVTCSCWDQGVILFMGNSNIYGLKLTANSRVGHETNGGLSNADVLSLPGTSRMLFEDFSDPTTLRGSWDTSDSGLTTAMHNAGFASSHNLDWSPTGTNVFGQTQKHLSNVYTVPTRVQLDGKWWLNLPIPNHCGEDGAYWFPPLNGHWPTLGQQKFFVGANSPYCRTLWLAYTWRPSSTYWSTVWRKVGGNYQDWGSTVQVTAGSNIVYVPGIANGGIHSSLNTINTMSGPISAPNWANGRTCAFLIAGDPADQGIFTVTGTIDDSHFTVSHTFVANSNSIYLAMSGAGDGVLAGQSGDFAVDSFKLNIFDETPPNLYPGNAGVAVLLNTRNNGVYTRLTKSPNVYGYGSGGQETPSIINDGIVPYNQLGDNRIVVRMEMTTTTHSDGAPFTNKRMTWWVNGVGGEDFPNVTDWKTSPGYSGDNDGSGFGFGPSLVEFTMQHTYGDPNQIFADTDYLITDVVTSVDPLPLSPIGPGNSIPTTPGSLGLTPQFLRRK